MLDLRQVRYFVAVAEEENVGRGAARLNISQSPLSRQIMQLEQQLGLMLFERAGKRLRLTPEGREFLDAARGLLAAAQRVEERGRRLGEGSAGALSIGYVEGAVHAGLVSATLRRFRLSLPDMQLHLHNGRSDAQVEDLRRGAIDAGFVYRPPAPEDRDVASALVVRERLVLALPADDPLCTLRTIKPEHLDGRTWILVVRQPNDTNREPFLAACAKAGFSPHIAYETADPLTSLGLVSAGLGLAVTQRSLKAIAPRDVAFRELPWFDRTVDIHFIWRRADQRASVAALRSAAGADGDQPPR